MKKPDPKQIANNKKKVEKEPEPEIDDSGPHVFEILKDKVKNNYIDPNKREKALLLNYTIAIFKPNVISLSKNCRIIIDKIEKENFEVFDFKFKYLTNEEIKNLYYKQFCKDFFGDILEYMSSGPVAILVLINKSETFLDQNGIETSFASPVSRWKEMIGYKDPSVAKPGTLRNTYGTSVIHNEFWGSDSASDAFRELSIFMLPLPSRPPKFSYDPYKIELKTLTNFLFPVKPNHPDVSGRLDIFSKYGPVLNNHILDQCVCTDCRQKIRDIIISREGKSLKNSKDKILTEEFINKYAQEFCCKCKEHFNSWSHLYSGIEQTHILTNEEIDFLILELNKEDLFTILKSEKGSCAQTVLSKVDLNNMPLEIHYTRQHIEKLISIVEKDFYDRFDFKELQTLILEDRRIRLNFWIHKIIGKPPTSFKNPKLINTGQFSSEDIKDIHNLKSKNFTLLRNYPIKVKNEQEEKLKSIIIEHPIFLKDKLSDQEVNQKVEKLLSKNLSKVTLMEQTNHKNIVSNMILLRNYELETYKEIKDKKTINKLIKKNK